MISAGAFLFLLFFAFFALLNAAAGVCRRYDVIHGPGGGRDGAEKDWRRDAGLTAGAIPRGTAAFLQKGLAKNFPAPLWRGVWFRGAESPRKTRPAAGSPERKRVRRLRVYGAATGVLCGSG